jgi:hypothetical protein
MMVLGLALRKALGDTGVSQACAASSVRGGLARPARPRHARDSLRGAASPPAARSQQRPVARLAAMAWPACPTRRLAVSLLSLYPARQLADLPARRRAASHPRPAGAAGAERGPDMA